MNLDADAEKAKCIHIMKVHLLCKHIPSCVMFDPVSLTGALKNSTVIGKKQMIERMSLVPVKSSECDSGEQWKCDIRRWWRCKSSQMSRG